MRDILSRALVLAIAFSALLAPAQVAIAAEEELYDLPDPHLWAGARPGHYANYIKTRLGAIKEAFGSQSDMEWSETEHAIVSLIEIWGIARNAQFDEVGCNLLDPVLDAIDPSRLQQLHSEPTRKAAGNEIEASYVMAQGRLHSVRIERCMRLLGPEAAKTREAVSAREAFYDVLQNTAVRPYDERDVDPALKAYYRIRDAQRGTPAPDPIEVLARSLDLRGKGAAMWGDVRAAEIYQEKAAEWFARIPDESKSGKHIGLFAMDRFSTGLNHEIDAEEREQIIDSSDRIRFECYGEMYDHINSGGGFGSFNPNQSTSCEPEVVTESFFASSANIAARTRFEIGLNYDSSRLALAYPALRAAIATTRAKEERRTTNIRSINFLNGYSPEVLELEQRLLDAMWFANRQSPTIEMEEEAFRILQLLNNSQRADAIAISDAQAKAGDAGLGPLIAELDAINKTDFSPLLQFDTVSSDYVQPDDYVDPKAELRALFARRTEILAEIERVFPEYFSLIRPGELTLAETKAMLRPDEAVFVFLPNIVGSHGFVVTHDNHEWVFDEGGSFATTRASLKLLWDVFADVPIPQAVEEFWVEESNGESVFSRDVAYELYQRTLGQHEEILRSKRRVFTLTNTGGLANLPFAMLVTENPRGSDSSARDLRRTSWLGDKFELGKLPTLQTLRILRQRDDATDLPANIGIFGIGDPLLEGEARDRSTTDRGKRRALTRSALDLRATPYLEAARMMDRLPGTREELESIATAFGDDGTTILLGDDATETALREADLSTPGLLVFATHGTMAGQLGGLQEAALILTPAPAGSNPEAEQDGILTASEIATFEFAAQWAVLSACNTATGQAGGAPGLSGLSRAFFHAGVENILASLWPVDDKISPVLTVGTITGQRRDGLSRGAALQAAMRAVRNNKSQDGEAISYAHPMFWAPFVLIGDVAD